MSGAQGTGFGNTGANLKNLGSTILSMTSPMLIARGIGTAKDVLSGNMTVGQAAQQPINTIKEIPMGMVRTGSNIVDTLPYVDTGEPGLNYANEWKRGTGLTTGVTDALNVFGAYGALGSAAKAARAAAPAVRATASKVGNVLSAGDDAGVLYFGRRERPMVTLGEKPPRLSARELAGQVPNEVSQLASKMAELVKNSTRQLEGVKPTIDPEDAIKFALQDLDQTPNWMQPLPSIDEVSKMLQQAEDYAQPSVMNPKRASEIAKPGKRENQQLWPDKWDDVDVSKELDLTRRFSNADEAAMAGPEVSAKWTAQQAFRDELIRLAEQGNDSLFSSGAFPSYVDPRTMGTYLKIVELPKLLTNPVIAEQYIRFMELFKP
jgi:hypothetical protein